MSPRLVKNNLNIFEFIKERLDESIIFTDVDGTLSEIAPNPDAAVVMPKMRDIVAALADKCQVVAISGRPAPVIIKMLGSEKIIYIGSHGRERLKSGKLTVEESSIDNRGIKAIKTVLARSISEPKNVYFEDKGSGMAVHYRLVENKNKVKKEILGAIRPLVKSLGLKVIEGKMVVEFSSTLTDKGEAMSEIIKELGKDLVLYLGDDQTDVDAFKKLKELRMKSEIKGFALGVLSPETPAGVMEEADYFFNSVSEVASFLEWLTEIT